MVARMGILSFSSLVLWGIYLCLQDVVLQPVAKAGPADAGSVFGPIL